MIQKVTESAQNWAEVLARFPGGKIETSTVVDHRPPKGWAERLAAVFSLPQTPETPANLSASVWDALKI